MATRAMVKIENYTLCAMYKHWGGSPENMLPFLEAFNKEFTKSRGIANENKMAQLLRATQRLGEKYKLDASIDCGYAIVSVDAHLNQEFEYLLKEDGTVTYIDL